MKNEAHSFGSNNWNIHGSGKHPSGEGEWASASRKQWPEKDLPARSLGKEDSAGFGTGFSTMWMWEQSLMDVSTFHDSVPWAVLRAWGSGNLLPTEYCPTVFGEE